MEGTRAFLQTISALKQNISSFAKGYKFIKPSISKNNQSWDEINMELMGRGRDKNI